MKRSGLIVMVIFLLLAIASLVMYFNRINATIHPNEVIEKVTTSFKKDLKVFLNTVNRTSTKIKQSRDAIHIGNHCQQQPTGSQETGKSLGTI